MFLKSLFLNTFINSKLIKPVSIGIHAFWKILLSKIHLPNPYLMRTLKNVQGTVGSVMMNCTAAEPLRCHTEAANLHLTVMDYSLQIFRNIKNSGDFIHSYLDFWFHLKRQ